MKIETIWELIIPILIIVIRIYIFEMLLKTLIFCFFFFKLRNVKLFVYPSDYITKPRS